LGGLYIEVYKYNCINVLQFIFLQEQKEQREIVALQVSKGNAFVLLGYQVHLDQLDLQ